MVVTKVELTNHAEREIKKLDPKAKDRIKEAIRALALGSLQASPLGGEWRGFFKFRVGDYRIIFKKLSPDSILIRYIRHRREAYR